MRGLLEIRCHNIRDWTTDKHRKTDDYLCGGGQGMLLKPEPIFAAVEELRRRETRVVLMTPQGRVAHRVVEELVDMELSIGDYILTNGAIASVVVIDAVARLIPGVLGDERSSVEESFSNGLLEAPAYTKPNVFRGLAVPEILLGGNHPAIEKWKHGKSLERTRLNRPECRHSRYKIPPATARVV